MRYRQLINDETFLKEKNTLQGKITQLKENLRETETRADKWLELTEKTFSFATYARNAFITAKGKEGLERKKEILLALGKTPIIQAGKLIIEANEWFVPIQNDYPALEAEYLRLEPTKMPMNEAKIEAIASISTRWLPSPEIIIPAKVVESFQNISYIGEMRQRWEEIKKLQLNPAIVTNA